MHLEKYRRFYPLPLAVGLFLFLSAGVGEKKEKKIILLLLCRERKKRLKMMQLAQAVASGIRGPRWITAQAIALNIAQNAVREGFVTASNKVRRALDLPPEKRPKKSNKSSKTSARGKRRENSRAAATSALVRVTDDALLAPTAAAQRLVVFDVLDCSLGSGGHSGTILETAPYARVVSLDCDYAARRVARGLATHFGADRYRHFTAKASDAKAMFGEDSFDAIVCDMGPSDEQLADPSRGFVLHLEDDVGMLDMRYGPQLGTSALQLLNALEYHYLVEGLIKYGLINVAVASRFVRDVCRSRPFSSGLQVLDLVQRVAGPFPPGGWWCSASVKRTPLSLKIMLSLRCLVNNEQQELEAVLNSAMMMLRSDGRLAVVTKLPWEEAMVRAFAQSHPFALLTAKQRLGEIAPLSGETAAEDGVVRPDETSRDVYRNDPLLGGGPLGEAFDEADEQALALRRHATVWVMSRSARSTYPLKNVRLTEEDVAASGARWVYGMHGGQSKGYPANNFGLGRMSRKEKKILERNNTGVPPFDHDDKHWK
jgi:16S rRNA (cytosine1402-N4)-methyltransferase